MTLTPNTMTIRLGDNVTIDAAGVIHVSSAAVAAGVNLKTTYVDGAGKAHGHDIRFQSDVPAETPGGGSSVASIFDAPAKVSEIATVPGGSPATISYVAGGKHARIAAKTGEIHTGWSKASGDGLYRALVRVSNDPSPIIGRRIGLTGRGRRVGTNWFGVRVEIFSNGSEKKIHLREYAGSNSSGRNLATADAAWAYGAWNWLEFDIRGKAVKGRIYAEGAAAPAWQVSANTTELGAGAFGPHLFPSNADVTLDVKQLVFTP